MGDFSLGDFIAALGLAFFIEGLAFIAFPEASRRMMAQVAQSPSAQLRVAGALAAAVGLALVWSVRG
jgi:uncharacterized protein YjeT (DUF2065 family)